MKHERLFYGFDAETVFDPQTALPGESLLSLIARTTLENELPNITTILRDVGQVHRNLMVDVMRKSIDVEGLAITLGIDLGTVQSMRARDAGNGLAHYLGSTIKTGDVHTKSRRFAPATLASDAVPYCRASWLIRTFPVCLQSWQVLRNRCDCGSTQTWATVGSVIFCGNCGEDLRELSAEVIPPEFRTGLTFLANILFGEGPARITAMGTLPVELRRLDPGEVYELALLTARIVDPTMGNPRERVWRDEPSRLARALSKAAPLLAEWPSTPWKALEVAGDTKIMLPRCEPLKALYRVLNGDHATNVAPSIKSTLDRIRLEITLDGENGRDDLVDLDRAAEILRVTKRTIRTARALGHLGVHFVIRRGEILPAYKRHELEATAATTVWPSAAVVGKKIGLPPYGVEQLAAIGEIEWAKAPYRTLRPELRLDPQSVDRFSWRLRSKAAPLKDLADPVAISVVVRGIGGREKPWATLLRGLLDGRWLYSLGRQGCVIREIVVERRDVDEIRRLYFDRSDWGEFPFSELVNQIDACDILNVPNRNRHVIMVHRIGRRKRGWLFERDAVVRLAESVVTTAELQARYLLETKTALAKIRRARLKPETLGFVRSPAIQRFDEYMATRNS